MARNPAPVNADPLIETPAAPVMDYPAHVKTYNGFLNLVKWFILHMAFLIPALYFFIVGGNSIAGAVLLLIAIGIVVYGILHQPRVRKNVSDAMQHKQLKV